MSAPFIGEVKMISWNFAPSGWAFCNGQLLPIAQNQALFSILGTIYGGDGRTTFALPNLQGATPVHAGNGITQGQRGGEAAHALTTNEIPLHTHTAQGTTATATSGTPTGNIWASQSASPFSSSAPNVVMSAAAFNNAGASQPHSNLQPYTVVNFIIALQGIFPTRN